jgi:hypothetical protein
VRSGSSLAGTRFSAMVMAERRRFGGGTGGAQGEHQRAAGTAAQQHVQQSSGTVCVASRAANAVASTGLLK